MYDTACNCASCKSTEKITLESKNDDQFKQVLNAGFNAFKQLHDKGSYKPEDLANTKEYQALIRETSKIFSSAIKDNDIPEKMANSLNEDVYVFSGLKTHAQLFEASRLLKKEDGTIKSFNEFSNDFNKINPKYNQQYLEAEHQFAISSAQGAGNWASLQNNTQRYLLQYRTAADDRVRANHQVLHLVTLPKDDPFWTSFYPPNGWRCRCIATEVLADKFEKSNTESAIKSGEKATTQISPSSKNSLEIFRFNPGQQKVIFPPKHPYSRVVGANDAKKILSNNKEKLKDHRAEIKQWGKDNLLNKTIKHPKIIKPISFNNSGIKEFANQPYTHEFEKVTILKNIEKIIKTSKYLGEKDETKNQMILKSHILEIEVKEDKSWLVLHEKKTGEITFYSISDGEKIKTGLKKK